MKKEDIPQDRRTIKCIRRKICLVFFLDTDETTEDKLFTNQSNLVKESTKVDGPDADKSEWIKLEFLMEPDNPS
jgi:hypothetical protein